MKGRIVLGVRIVLGLIFVVFGLNGFFQFIEIPPPPTEEARQFFKVLMPTNYLGAVKVLEIVGGALLLSGLFPLIGLVLISPIVFNIFLYEILLAQKPGLGMFMLPMIGVLLWGYWSHVKGIFAMFPSTDHRNG